MIDQNLSPTNRRVYLGTCWKFDATPHVSEDAYKVHHYFRAETRDPDGTVLGTRFDTVGGKVTHMERNSCLMPKLGMTQIDDWEFGDVMTTYHKDTTW